MSDRWTLKGKKALVTGATKGIGLAVATEFLSLGAEVTIVARNSEDINQQLSIWQQAGLPAYHWSMYWRRWRIFSFRFLSRNLLSSI